MLEKEKMNRLNELARKKKTTALSPAEQMEQDALRKEYLASFRTHMKSTIENVTIIDPEGKDITPDKIKEKRAREDNEN